MKERIVFKTESSIKGRKEIAKINEYVNNFNFDCAFERKVEQVPENFDELKELCKATKHMQDILKKNREGHNIPVHFNNCGTGYIIIKDLYFGENGTVFYEVKEQRYIIAKDLTFAQMYQIIKNLIGEE